ncbi:MAG: metal ABC transporter substrate-binding protein [Tissierellia bacterium]|nr:metal ABC transporter substrate-binding protein [Tissierellia bacterium]
MKLSGKIVIFGTILLFLFGCSKESHKNLASKPEEHRLKVYASVYPMYDFAQKIGGEKIDLELIVPSGQEPHNWEPGQQDIKKLEKGDLFIYNGAGLEHWIDKVIASLDNQNLTVIEASKGIELIGPQHRDSNEDSAHNRKEEHQDNHNHKHEAEEDHSQGHHHDHKNIDPHVWLSPVNAKLELENIKNALVEADPKHKAYYEQNYQKYGEAFDELDQEYRKQLMNVEEKTIVVSHEAFGYLCREYGLQQMGIEGINAETEPDAKTMAKIIDFVKSKGITTIFTEELMDPKIAETIAKETGAVTSVLSPLEGRSQDQIDKNSDYIEIMKENLENLRTALQ